MSQSSTCLGPGLSNELLQGIVDDLVHKEAEEEKDVFHGAASGCQRSYSEMTSNMKISLEHCSCRGCQGNRAKVDHVCCYFMQATVAGFAAVKARPEDEPIHNKTGQDKWSS
jgi:hypothetical protein